jgi:hypothetical protein
MVDMDTGDFLAAIVKEFATEMTGSMAIYCSGLDLKINMRGRNYHIEILDEDKKWKPMSVFKDKDVIKYLILKKGALRPNGLGVALVLRHKKVVFAKDYLLCSMDTREQNDATLNEYLKVLESEISIASQQNKN